MSASVRTRRWLLPLVFISGMASLGVEFGAARLLAPYFGTSLYVWGVLIGLILIYLSAGYVIGGRLADRHPRDEVLYQITAWAGLWIGIIPLVSYPILLMSQQGFKELSVGLVAGTLLAVVLLFAAPVILLGCVSPFATSRPGATLRDASMRCRPRAAFSAPFCLSSGSSRATARGRRSRDSVSRWSGSRSPACGRAAG